MTATCGPDESELTQHHPMAAELIVESHRAKGVPQADGIDGEDRLPEPALGLVGDLDHRQVRPALNNGVDVVAVESPEFVHDGLRSDVGNGRCGRALQAVDALYVVSAFGEVAMDLLVADTLIRSDTRNALDAETFESRVAGISTRCDAKVATDLPDPCLERGISLFAAPEGLGRHAHEDVVRFARHHVANGGWNGVADQVEKVQERLVAAEVGCLDEEPAAVKCDTCGPNAVQIVFDNGVRRRDDHTDLGSVSNDVRHVMLPGETAFL